MDPRAEGSVIHSLPHAFINRRGGAILVNTLDDRICQQLIEMYLAYQPRNSFQGLPPIKDEMCIKWVQDMIRNGINLVALSYGEGVVGHAALFPVDNVQCEFLVVVSPPFQNIGIGTELTRCSSNLAHEIGFETIRLSVEATNLRARHVYKKCGFEYLSPAHAGEVEMGLDLKRYRDAVGIAIAEIMNKDVLAIDAAKSCRCAIEMFLQHHVGSMPVVDDDGRLVGILSKSDLMLPFQMDKKVSDIYTRGVLSVPEDSTIERVIRIFQSKRVRCIPVVDSGNRLVGVVGREDVLKHYRNRFWTER